MCKQILPNILRQSQNTLVTFLHGSLFYFGYFTTKGSERQNGFLPVFETRYRYALFPSSLTRGRTGQRNEGVEFRRTPQAESLRPEEGRGLPCAPGTGVTPGQEANPGAGARSHPQTPPRRPTPPRSAGGPRRGLPRREEAETGHPLHPRTPRSQATRWAGDSGPPPPALLPPPFPAPTDLETAMAARSWASREASGGTAGRGGGRRRSPREEGAGPSSGLSGAAPGLGPGPAGDPRGAAERGCGRQRSEFRSPRRGSSGAGGSGAQPSKRDLKLLFPHRQGEAQCLVLYEQPSCIYSLPP